MKRSDVIESLVYHCLSWDGLDTSGVPAEEIANDILTHLEKMGMQPPKIQQYVLPNGQSEFAYMEWINKWED